VANVVVVSGIDVEVVKFPRHNPEVSGLAILEPVGAFGSNAAFAAQVPPSSNKASIYEHDDLSTFCI
jgi:hypothetical protein